METKKKWYQSLLVKLLLGIAVGIGIGLIANEGSMQVIGSLKNLLGQLINYCVPLIILAFITPAIVGLKENAGKKGEEFIEQARSVVNLLADDVEEAIGKVKNKMAGKDDSRPNNQV